MLKTTRHPSHTLTMPQQSLKLDRQIYSQSCIPTSAPSQGQPDCNTLPQACSTELGSPRASIHELYVQVHGMESQVAPGGGPEAGGFMRVTCHNLQR